MLAHLKYNKSNPTKQIPRISLSSEHRIEFFFKSHVSPCPQNRTPYRVKSHVSPCPQNTVQSKSASTVNLMFKTAVPFCDIATVSRCSRRIALDGVGWSISLCKPKCSAVRIPFARGKIMSKEHGHAFLTWWNDYFRLQSFILFFSFSFLISKDRYASR